MVFYNCCEPEKRMDLRDGRARVASSGVKPLEDYARGLVDDYGAVKASMMSEVSNGVVEGLNNRLKLLKRQMYGRAGLELLQRRFLLAS
jgi:transposase